MTALAERPSGAPPPVPANTDLESWGRYPPALQTAITLEWRDQAMPPIPAGMTALPYGLGRSYGDSCLNNGGAVIRTHKLDRYISFDRATGVLRCESGVSLSDIIRLAVPRGWFLPVTPGTKFVTLGGAIANDVHGKNHHRAGTFGRHVRAFELVRSDGSRHLCTPTQNPALFQATIGGLGLTGVITWAEVQLRPVDNAFIQAESIKFGNLEEFFSINEESERDFEYTVAWIDCMARGRSLGRGHYNRGNHAPPQHGKTPPARGHLPLMVPFNLPDFVLSEPMIRTLCFLYYNRQFRRRKAGLLPFDPFFYPLDFIQHWNRGYGKQGFFQYQLVVPISDSKTAIKEILEVIARSGQASFVSVLKTFGDLKSPGLLSFPRPGITLALDFSNRGDRTRRLFDTLDRIVYEAGGAIYPAKDAHMSGEGFRRFFPRWQEMVPHIDPCFSSSFWRRVMLPELPNQVRSGT